MDYLFPWHYDGYARGFQKYRLALMCLIGNTINLAVYTTTILLIVKAVF